MATRDITRIGPAGYFYECPRWHDGCWWLSDMRDQKVLRLGADGQAQTVIELDDRPGGLGWLPDGTMLVVSMEHRQLLYLGSDGAIRSRLDLGELTSGNEGFLNDLAVGSGGDIYVGFCQDPFKHALDEPLGALVHVNRNGEPHLAARGLAFPNGIVLAPDGDTLVVAETGRPRLSAFAVASDGSLGERKDWALLEPLDDARSDRSEPIGLRTITLDGCGMDAEAHVWAADTGGGCMRVAPGGKVVEAVILPDDLRAYACMLGGNDGRTLMICAADGNHEKRMSRRGGRLFVTTVSVPAA